jgi:formylglycine-generating enzyme required for sulfatase activity
MRKLLYSAVALASLPTISSAQTITETFGSGANQFSIDFVTIGNPGNAADTTGVPNPVGSVGYIYNLGKYEISREMVEKANAAGGLGLSLADMSSFGGNGANRPASGISWHEAAKFVNYLNTSKNFQAAYKFDENGEFRLWESGQFSVGNQYRHKDSFYFLPSVDEWYKAAYGSSNGTWYDFPTGSNSAPIGVSGGTSTNTAVYLQANSAGPSDIANAGGLSAFGTMGQGGNVWEWNESALDGSNDVEEEYRDLRGGSWYFGNEDLTASSRSNDVLLVPTDENIEFGFRVASVPEPSSLSLLVFGGVLVALRRRR